MCVRKIRYTTSMRLQTARRPGFFYCAALTLVRPGLAVWQGLAIQIQPAHDAAVNRGDADFGLHADEATDGARAGVRSDRAAVCGYE